MQTQRNRFKYLYYETNTAIAFTSGVSVGAASGSIFEENNGDLSHRLGKKRYIARSLTTFWRDLPGEKRQ